MSSKLWLKGNIESTMAGDDDLPGGNVDEKDEEYLYNDWGV